jgi:hypothetical protein
MTGGGDTTDAHAAGRAGQFLNDDGCLSDKLSSLPPIGTPTSLAQSRGGVPWLLAVKAAVVADIP